jgi:hypothetical protein
MTCKFLPDKTGKKYFYADASGAIYSNITQSPKYKNCHLIAALSSLAWINNKFFNPSQNTGTCTYSFWDPDSSAAVPVKVNSNIFMDDGTGIWCCASSKLPETWPAMYEKAFAKFCLYKIVKVLSAPDLNNSVVDPDFSKLPKGSDWGGNPVYVLRCLIGRAMRNFPYTTKSFNLDSAAIYAHIKALCVTATMGKSSPLGIVNGAKLQYPMGAWTYIDANDAKTIAGIDIAYDNSSMVADHCYSILGIYENNGSQYIVLRNPYGLVDADTAKYASGKGPWIYFEKRYQMGNFTADAAGKIVQLDFSPADGIFALDVKVFTRYFKGFGHITT